MDKTFSPVEFADFVKTRLRVVVVSSAVALALVLVVSALTPRRYTASASILIGAPAGIDPRAATSVNAVYLESLKAYESVALSDTIFSSAVDTLKLQDSLGPPTESLKRSILKVSKLPGTAILEIKATLRDPRQAHALALFIAERTVGVSLSLNTRASIDATLEFRHQIEAAQARLQQTRQARDSLALAEPVEPLETEVSGEIELESKLNRDLALARTDLAGYFASAAESEEPASLRARIAAIESQERELAAIIAKQSAQLAARRNRRDEIENDQRAAEEAFDVATARLNDAAAASSVRGERLQIIDPGIVPGQPSHPNTLLNLLAALLFSLAGSGAWLALRFSYLRLAREQSAARVLSLRQRHDIDLKIPQ